MFPPFLEGCISPRIKDIVVDFPAPFGPNKLNTSPLLIPKVKFSTAVTLPKDLVKCNTLRPSFELLTRVSSSATSSGIASSDDVVGFVFFILLHQATIEPLSYQSKRAKRKYICKNRYNIGPPYIRMPPGFRESSFPSQVVENILRAMNRVRTKLPIGVNTEMTKCTRSRYESILSIGA